MSHPVPSFPLTGEPGEWADLTLLAATIFLESEAEPPDGMLGVAWVVRTRMDLERKTVAQVILGPDGKAWDDGRAFEPWSCWNDDYRARGQARLGAALDGYHASQSELAWRAAAGGYWRLLTDPTDGAYFYLNVELTKKIRKGTLPAWAATPGDPTMVNAAKVTAVFGRHTFMRG